MNTASANPARVVSAILLSCGPRFHAGGAGGLLHHGIGKRQPVWGTFGTLETPRAPRGSVATGGKISSVILSTNVPSPTPVP